MRDALTRRGLVTAAPAAIVAAAIPAAAVGASADAALMALRGPYERSLAALDAALRALEHVEETHVALGEAHPEWSSRKLQKASGLACAERAYRQADSANFVVIRQIEEQPATTLEGVVFKARVSQREDNTQPGLVASMVNDLLAMGGAHA